MSPLTEVYGIVREVDLLSRVAGEHREEIGYASACCSQVPPHESLVSMSEIICYLIRASIPIRSRPPVHLGRRAPRSSAPPRSTYTHTAPGPC